MQLRALQIFEAVGRHRSVTAAAAELGVTQSAVSHQLRNLQHHLGETLIERRGREINLTPAGEKLAASLDSAFDLIEQSTTFDVSSERPTLRIGVYSSFAIGWFIPLFASCQSANPNTDLRLVLLYDPHEISPRIADVFVTSEPVQRGYRATRLFAEELVPVIGSSRMQDETQPSPLITSEVASNLAGRDWEAFALLNDMPLPRVPMLCCTHYIFSLKMVQCGLGASLIPDFLAEAHIRAGELRRLPGRPLPTGQVYQVQVKYERSKDPEVVRFVKWLKTALGNR